MEIEQPKPNVGFCPSERTEGSLTGDPPVRFRSAEAPYLTCTERTCLGVAEEPLEAQSCAQLDLPSRRGNLGNASQARGIHETVGRPQIGVVERIEELCSRFESGFLSYVKLTYNSQIHRLQTGAINGIASRVSVGVGGRSRKRSGVEPRGGVARSRRKDLLAGNVGANRILADNRSCVCGIAEHGDGEREAALSLVYDGTAPVACEGSHDLIRAVGFGTVDRANSKPMVSSARRGAPNPESAGRRAEGHTTGRP
jgi:hypothetical protein